jgi:hypothetical protein
MPQTNPDKRRADGPERDELIQFHRLVALDRLDAGDADENGGGALLVAGEAALWIVGGRAGRVERTADYLIGAAVWAGAGRHGAVGDGPRSSICAGAISGRAPGTPSGQSGSKRLSAEAEVRSEHRRKKQIFMEGRGRSRRSGVIHETFDTSIG